MVKVEVAIKAAKMMQNARIPKKQNVTRLMESARKEMAMKMEVEEVEEVEGEVGPVFLWYVFLHNTFLGCSKDKQCDGSKPNCDTDFGECYKCRSDDDCKNSKKTICNGKKCKKDPKIWGEDGEESSSEKRKRKKDKSCNWEEASFFSFCTAKTIYKYSKPGYKVDIHYFDFDIQLYSHNREKALL